MVMVVRLYELRSSLPTGEIICLLNTLSRELIVMVPSYCFEADEMKCVK